MTNAGAMPNRRENGLSRKLFDLLVKKGVGTVEKKSLISVLLRDVRNAIRPAKNKPREHAANIQPPTWPLTPRASSVLAI
jgi:hypothetical protein